MERWARARVILFGHATMAEESSRSAERVNRAKSEQFAAPKRLGGLDA